jgi:uncharacterized protein involved in exopolysaccharide biosynthesis
LELPSNAAGHEPADQTTRPTARHWLRYAGGAARRRPLLAAVVFLAGVGAALATYRLSTPRYRVEARVMIQNQRFGGLGRGPGAGQGEEAPIRSIFDLIHRRENLLALLEHAGVQPAPATPPDAWGKFQDSLAAGLAGFTGGATTPEDPKDALVRRLDKALKVTSEDGTVTITTDWPDAGQAFKLVDGALQNFLEDRHVQEITMADEAVALLQPRVSTLRDQLERVLEELRRTAAEAETSRRAERPAAAPAPGEPSEDLFQLKASLDTTERAIGDVEEIRRRRATDLQSQLDAQRAVLSDLHPNIITLRQDIAALSKDSPQIALLREDARKLRQDYVTRQAMDPRRKAARPATAGYAPPRAAFAGPVEENERVRLARFQYQQMNDRLNVAMLERDAAGAAFKYRYLVSWPAELPRNPATPSALRILGLGLLGAALLSLLVVSVLEHRRGRIVQRWQIELLLGLPILAEQERH